MTARRIRSIGLLGMAVGLLFTAACGDDDEDSNDAEAAPPLPTHTIAAQSYTQKPPVTATEGVDLGDVAPGEVVDVEQEYTVQPGDFMFGIAEMFEVSAEEIANYNRYDDGVNHQLQPGDTVLIPPGAIRPGGLTTTTTEPLAGADVAEAEEDDEEDDATTEGAGDNCGEGSYTVESNDYPIGVAAKFDVTLDALNAANDGTPGYSEFYPGTQIVIPAKSDC